MNDETWDRDKICHHLWSANQGVVQYEDIKEIISQAELYIKTKPDSTISGHLEHLYPKLKWFKELDDERNELKKDRKFAFRNALIGTLTGAFIGLFGSILITYFSISSQNQMSYDNSKLSRELSSDLINQLDKLKEVIQNLEKIESKKYENQVINIEGFNARLLKLEQTLEKKNTTKK